MSHAGFVGPPLYVMGAISGVAPQIVPYVLLTAALYTWLWPYGEVWYYGNVTNKSGCQPFYFSNDTLDSLCLPNSTVLEPVPSFAVDRFFGFVMTVIIAILVLAILTLFRPTLPRFTNRIQVHRMIGLHSVTCCIVAAIGLLETFLNPKESSSGGMNALSILNSCIILFYLCLSAVMIQVLWIGDASWAHSGHEMVDAVCSSVLGLSFGLTNSETIALFCIIGRSICKLIVSLLALHSFQNTSRTQATYDQYSYILKMLELAELLVVWIVMLLLLMSPFMNWIRWLEITTLVVIVVPNVHRVCVTLGTPDFAQGTPHRQFISAHP